MIEIDVSTLNDEQLTALAMIAPEAVMEEKDRRESFSTLDEFFNALLAGSLRLETSLAGMRGTAAVKAVRDSGLLDVVRRGLTTARHLGYVLETPSLEETAS